MPKVMHLNVGLVLITLVASGLIGGVIGEPKGRGNVGFFLGLLLGVNALPIRQRVFVESDSALVDCQSV